MQITPLRTQTQLPAQHRKTQWGTILPALAAGLAAAGFAFVLVRSRQPALAAAPPTVSVVVAARDIPARTKLTLPLLCLRLVAPGDLPEGAAETTAALAGKVLMQPISAGNAVTQSMVAAPSAALGLAFTLPPSLRAVTVATDPADGVDLFVRPEDHVDILATDEPGSESAEARTVLQNVLLLAVGSQTSPDPPPVSAAAGGASHVTVAVTPVQAQALVLASARGHLHLALRAIGDGSETSLPAFPAPSVMAAPRPKPVPPAPKPMTPLKIRPLPVSLLALPPVPSPAPPAHVTVTVIKGTVSQAVSVAP